MTRAGDTGGPGVSGTPPRLRALFHPRSIALIGASDNSGWSQTGAPVGDDNVVDAVFRQLGVVRVRSLEDLIVTAGLLASGPLPGPRLGVVTPSGGASEIIADRAQAEASNCRRSRRGPRRR